METGPFDIDDADAAEEDGRGVSAATGQGGGGGRGSTPLFFMAAASPAAAAAAGAAASAMEATEVMAPLQRQTPPLRC